MPSGKLSCLNTIPNISIEFLTEELEDFFFFYPFSPLSKVTKNMNHHWSFSSALGVSLDNYTF